MGLIDFYTDPLGKRYKKKSWGQRLGTTALKKRVKKAVFGPFRALSPSRQWKNFKYRTGRKLGLRSEFAKAWRSGKWGKYAKRKVFGESEVASSVIKPFYLKENYGPTHNDLIMHFNRQQHDGHQSGIQHKGMFHKLGKAVAFGAAVGVGMHGARRMAQVVKAMNGGGSFVSRFGANISDSVNRIGRRVAHTAEDQIPKMAAKGMKHKVMKWMGLPRKPNLKHSAVEIAMNLLEAPKINLLAATSHAPTFSQKLLARTAGMPNREGSLNAIAPDHTGNRSDTINDVGSLFATGRNGSGRGYSGHADNDDFDKRVKINVRAKMAQRKRIARSKIRGIKTEESAANGGMIMNLRENFQPTVYQHRPEHKSSFAAKVITAGVGVTALAAGAKMGHLVLNPRLLARKLAKHTIRAGEFSHLANNSAGFGKTHYGARAAVAKVKKGVLNALSSVAGVVHGEKEVKGMQKILNKSVIDHVMHGRRGQRVKPYKIIKDAGYTRAQVADAVRHGKGAEYAYSGEYGKHQQSLIKHMAGPRAKAEGASFTGANPTPPQPAPQPQATAKPKFNVNTATFFHRTRKTERANRKYSFKPRPNTVYVDPKGNARVGGRQKKAKK